MTQTNPFHAAPSVLETITYHNNDNCYIGQRLTKKVLGHTGKHLCAHCARLNKQEKSSK